MTPELRAWRRAERERLLALRRAIASGERAALSAALADRLDAAVPATAGATLGFYWPIKGEVDLRAWAAAFAARHGMALALPVVAEKAAPLEFRPWAPGAAMERGFWDILVPADRTRLRPDVVIAPLVGFQAAGCFRLGYGGGYFDRTLATLRPRPLTIGVGFELGRIETTRPQAHDIRLDMIVTEAGTWTFASAVGVAGASCVTLTGHPPDHQEPRRDT